MKRRSGVLIFVERCKSSFEYEGKIFANMDGAYIHMSVYLYLYFIVIFFFGHEIGKATR